MRTELSDVQADLLSTALMVEATSGIVFWIVVFVGLCLVCQQVWGRS